MSSPIAKNALAAGVGTGVIYKYIAGANNMVSAEAGAVQGIVYYSVDTISSTIGYSVPALFSFLGSYSRDAASAFIGAVVQSIIISFRGGVSFFSGDMVSVMIYNFLYQFGGIIAGTGALSLTGM